MGERNEQIIYVKITNDKYKLKIYNVIKHSKR